MTRPRYIADAYACVALAGIRMIERSATHWPHQTEVVYTLTVTYKGYACKISYKNNQEACEAMYQRLTTALTDEETREKGTPHAG